VKIYIVSGLVDMPDEQATAALSAHVDEGIARSAANAYDRQHAMDIGRYAVVETVELDLSGIDLETGALARLVADAERRLTDR
jgi:hypothetical protein